MELCHVSFAYAGGAPLLCDVSLRLERGVTAFVGENGCGKSTLLKLLAGELEPESGTIRTRSRIAYCPQEVELIDPRVAAFLEAQDADAVRLRASLQVTASALDRANRSSPGERRRLQLAAALHQAPDLLLLDEPTNHVDLDTRRLFVSALRAFRGITVLVSHDRALIDALAARTVRLHRGTLRAVDGGYTHARDVWTRDEERARSARERLLHEAHKAETKLRKARAVQNSAERSRSARGLMKDPHDRDGRSMGRKNLAAWAEARASRSVAVHRGRVEAVHERLAEHHVEKRVGRSVFASYEPCPRSLLMSLEDATLSRDAVPILQNVSLTVPRQARIRIEGKNGAGKSTLLQALYEKVRERDRVLYVPQELTRAEIVTLLAVTHALPREEKGRVLNLVAALGVDPDRLLRSRSPSSGEARKLFIAQGLGRHVWALLLDEPTHHLDLPSVERLEDALRGYPGALLVVTHDPTFLVDHLELTWRVAERSVRVLRHGESQATPRVTQ